MSQTCRNVSLLGALVLGATGWPGPARADVAHVIHSRTDDRGGGVHLVPRSNQRVRMAAERIVLVPYYEARKWQPRLLCHVWYDLLNEGPRTRLLVGFPELKALYLDRITSNMGPTAILKRSIQKWTLPTILAFGARLGTRLLPVRPHPGVGRYRRWYTFGIDLAAGQRARVHTTYLATLGSTRFSMDRDEDDRRYVTQWFLHYVLHTGARWHGTIGQGEILLYSRGRLRSIRRWKNLEPTAKDDLNLGLDLMVDRKHEDKPEELAPGEFGHRLPPGNRLVTHRLVRASSTLESAPVDTHVGLIVDGDPATRWVSGKRESVGAYVQLPSDDRHDLGGLRVAAGTPGPGQVRPARVEVRCLDRWRWARVADAALADTAGPQEVSLAKARRCRAVRLVIRAVHGDKSHPVTIAEVEQKLAGTEAAKGAGKGSGPSREDPLARPKSGPGSAEWPLPAARDPRAFELAEIDDVSWSADGSLVHYRLHLENVRQRVRGMRLGVFADVATGRLVRSYRLDRHGDLPEPYQRYWREGMTYEAAAAFLARHGFRTATAGRQPPRRSTVEGQRLQLVGEIVNEPKALAVAVERHGFRWRYSPRSYQQAGPARASLELRYRVKREAPRVLASRAPVLDRGFAGRHVRVWQARKELFATAVQEYIAELKKMGLETDVTKEDARKWHMATYPQWQAYQGEARVFWDPRGEALLVFWSDHQDYSGAVPDPKPAQVVPECAELEWKVCSWDRKDDVRRTVAVTVHALTPRQPTTLLAAYRPPAGPARPGSAATGAAMTVKSFPTKSSGGRPTAARGAARSTPKRLKVENS